MKILISLTLFAVGFAIGLAMYESGRQSIVRECPEIQNGQRLLSSEQRLDSTVCTYASGWDGYGRNLKQRRAPRHES